MGGIRRFGVDFTVVLVTKFERVDLLSVIDFCVDVLVSGMSFLALARNLSSGSRLDLASYLPRWQETFDFDPLDKETSLRRYLLTPFSSRNSS